MRYYMLIIALFSTAVDVAFADAYKWENSNKEVEYSQVPPEDVESTGIATPPPSSTTAPPSSPNTSALTDQQKKERREKAIREATDEVAKEEAEVKAENCKRAQKALHDLQLKPRIKFIDQEGNTTMLTPEQREEEIRKAQEGINTNCPPAPK